jgi:hypothetical protein
MVDRRDEETPARTVKVWIERNIALRRYPDNDWSIDVTTASGYLSLREDELKCLEKLIAAARRDGFMAKP